MKKPFAEAALTIAIMIAWIAVAVFISEIIHNAELGFITTTFITAGAIAILYFGRKKHGH